MFESAYEKIRQRLHVPPGIVVLIVVLVLLYGFTGAVMAVFDMAMTLLAALVGGGDHDVVGSVLWRTLPLAIAAAGVTFAMCNRWLTPGSLNSYIGMAMIVLSGAIVGNACYERCGSRSVVIASEPDVNAAMPTPVGLADDSALPLVQSLQLTPTVKVAAAPAPPNAWQRLAAINWLGKPDLSRDPQPVEPLRVVPKGPGIYGGVGGAINQLLGYLVDYEPRLFLASIFVGSFVGWRLQRRVAIAHAVVAGDLSELTQHEKRKLEARA